MGIKKGGEGANGRQTEGGVTCTQRKKSEPMNQHVFSWVVLEIQLTTPAAAAHSQGQLQ